MTLLFVRYRFFFFWFLFSFSLFGKQKVTKLCMPVTIFLHSSRPLYIIHIIMYLRAAVYIYIYSTPPPSSVEYPARTKQKEFSKKYPGRPPSYTAKRQRETTTTLVPPRPPPHHPHHHHRAIIIIIIILRDRAVYHCSIV